MKKDYKHASLTSDETNLLVGREDLSGESIDTTRIKLSDPAQRAGFLDEVAHVVKCQKVIIESLVEVLWKVTLADREGNDKIWEKTVSEDRLQAIPVSLSYDTIQEESIKAYILLMLDAIKNLANRSNVTPENILEVLSTMTTDKETDLPFPFTEESLAEIKKRISGLEKSAGVTFQNIVQKLKDANQLDQENPTGNT